MNLHLDHHLFLMLGKGILLSSILILVGAVILRRRSAHTASLYWRMSLLGLIILPLISLSLPWLPIVSAAEPDRATETPAAGVAERAEVLVLAEPSGVPLDAIGEGEAPSPGRLEFVPGLPEKEIHSASLVEAIVAPVGAAQESRTDWRATLGIMSLSVWAVGALFVFGRWLRARAKVRAVVKGATEVEDWSGEAGRFRVRLATSPDINSPLVVGVTNPTIVLPMDAVGWPPAQREQVLGHELCHVRRSDSLFLLLARLAVALHWINPLVWMMARRLRMADERTADDAVLRAGNDPGQYASLLATFARREMPLSEAVAPSMARGSSVGVRVKRILDDSQQRDAPRIALRVVLALVTILVVAVAGGLSIAPAEAQENPQPAPEEPAPVSEDPLADAIVDEGTNAIPSEQGAIDHLSFKLKNIVVPEVDIDEATLAEAIDFMRSRAMELDRWEVDPTKKGINIVVLGKDLDTRVLSKLKLKNVPLETVLEFVTKHVGCEFKITEHAVVIVAQGQGVDQETDAGMLTRIFKVPPDFLTRLGAKHRVNDDPFSDAEAKPRKGLLDLLTEAGIKFGEGESVRFIPAQSQLLVTARAEVQELVAVLVDDINGGLPKMIKARIELYEVSKAEALKILKHDQDKNDGREAYAMVEALLARKEAILLASPTTSLRSGQRAKLVSGTELTYISAYEAKDGKDAPVVSKVRVGSEVQIEAVIGADNQTIDLQYALTMSRGEAKMVRREVIAPVSGKKVAVESVLLDAFSLAQGCTTMSGQTQLLGTMRTSVDSKASSEILAFLTATVTRVLK